MSPEQLKMLQNLSQMFEEGRAGPTQIKELSELLSLINRQHDVQDPLNFNHPMDLEAHL